MNKKEASLRKRIAVLQRFIDKRPLKTIDEHLTGGVFHVYCGCPDSEEYEQWFRDFAVLWSRFLREFEEPKKHGSQEPRKEKKP